MKIKNIIEGKESVKVYPTTTIRDALITMNNSGTRRITVVDAGTNRVVGIITSMDIVDFMGGGSKYNLVKSKHNHNLLAAINEPVKEIMTNEAVCIKENALLKEVIELFIEKNVGGVPVVDKDYKLISTITERDIIRFLKDNVDKSEKVIDYMTEKPVVATSGERLKDVARTMLRNGFRRLPVISEDRLVGMITSTDFIKLLGSDWAFNHMKTGNVREITNVRIKDIMVKDVLTVNKDASLYDAVDTMTTNDIGALPVVEDGKVIGIITEKDAVSYFKE
ncbi:CBS domain-containing protein [Methanothermococcus okinawensis]|uniref:Signal transduction protein with CBS domains n=1 Tax=Methanothermococcus okinawensis (strain DSM 14208 / JCM 11175 / IH1) TaxID=647113 RepID=F8AMF2_METOI|nr:CBS domain-containing protein [Methanothermococcus okinawensis]AEH06849.1 putative signal transduction protein with CBS domains [Methanothermococcus okinawensis IH1]